MGPLTQLWLVAVLALSPVLSGIRDGVPAVPAEPAAAFLATPAPFPLKQPGAVEPVVQAKSALLIDLPSGAELFSRQPNASRPIASLTKLMTALLVVERTKPDAVVTMPALQNKPEESLMGARPGDQFHVDDLLAGALIVSGNDAATALGRQVAGSDEVFVNLMNKRAAELGLRHTHFDNPTGYGTGENVSTARDLAILSRAALAEPRIRSTVVLKEAKVAALNVPAPTPDNPNPTEPNQYDLKTTDALLGSYLPIAGLKTGTSDAAGPCLITVLSSGDRQVLAVVLDSPSRFQENKAMLDWSLRSFRW